MIPMPNATCKAWNLNKKNFITTLKKKNLSSPTVPTMTCNLLLLHLWHQRHPRDLSQTYDKAHRDHHLAIMKASNSDQDREVWKVERDPKFNHITEISLWYGFDINLSKVSFPEIKKHKVMFPSHLYARNSLNRNNRQLD